jgi:hypothetical protein
VVGNLSDRTVSLFREREVDRSCHTTDAHPTLLPRPTTSHRLRKLRRRAAPHWIDHGETAPENLVLLCRFHHGVVHRPGWSVELKPGAEVIVASPEGGDDEHRVPRTPPP